MNQILALIEIIAEKAGSRRTMLVESFFGLSQQEMSSPQALTPASASRLKDTLMNIGWSHVESEGLQLRESIAEISREARTSALSDLGISTAESVREALSVSYSVSEDASWDYGSGEIVAQTERDVIQVIKLYRNASIAAEMIKSAANITHQEAVMRVSIDQFHIRQKSWFKDRAGRKIPSQKYIRRLWRQVLRDLYIDIYLQILAEHGERYARIWHPDPSHHAFGEVFMLDGSEPTRDDFADVFHPNAKALPMAERKFKEITK